MSVFLATTSSSFALEGVDYVQFEVKGKIYDVPIPNRETRQDFLYLKKAFNGDEDYRDILLSGKDKKMFFIGDIGVVRWLKLTKTDVEIIEP